MPDKRLFAVNCGGPTNSKTVTCAFKLKKNRRLIQFLQNSSTDGYLNIFKMIEIFYLHAEAWGNYREVVGTGNGC